MPATARPDVPRSTRPDLRRRLGRWAPGAGVALAILLLTVSRYLAVDPSWQFHFGSVKSPEDVQRLLELAERIRSIREWKPPWVSEGSARALADLLVLNPDVRDLRELLRSADDSTDPPLAARTASLNGTINLLSKRVTAARLASMQRRPEDLPELLEAELDAAIREERERALTHLFGEPALKELFERHRLPWMPDAPGWARRVACRLWSHEIHDRELWFETFADQAKPVLQPISNWYQEIAAARSLPFGSDGAVLARTSPNESGEGLTFAGFESTADFKLLVPDPALINQPEDGEEHADQRLQSWTDSGIRLFDTRLKRTPRAGKEQPDEADVAIAWPPRETVVLTDEFAAMLHQYGLPRAFAVRDIARKVRGASRPLELAVEFRIVHREVESCAWDSQIVFGAEAAPVSAQLAGIMGTAALERLRAELPNVTKYAGLQVQFTLAEHVADLFRCEIRVPEIKPLHVRVSITPEGWLCWSGLPSITERASIAARLCREIPALRDWAGLVSINSVNVRSGSRGLSGTLSLRTDVIGRESDRLQEIPWSITPDGAMAVAVSEFRLGSSPRAHERPPANSIDPDALTAEVSTHIRLHYRALADHITVAPVSVGPSGVFIRLGLRLADWPEIELGPTIVESEGEMANVVDALLEEGAVCEAADRQWNAAISHPHYGLTKSSLLDFSPRTGRSRIRSIIWSAQPWELQWEHELELESGRWTAVLGQDLASFLEGSADKLEHDINTYCREISGGRIELERDRNAFGPGRWYRLNPATLAFRASFRLAELPRVTAGRVLVDSGGIHWPEKFTATLLSTWPMPPTSPWCAISDPEITIDFARSGLGIGCKLTPPSVRPLLVADAQQTIADELAGPIWFRFDNPWLHVAYLHGEISGALQQKEMAADAYVRLLERHDAARAHLSLNFDTRTLHGHLRSRPVPLAGLPDLNGQLYLAADGELDVGAQTSIAGCRLEGRLRYLWHPEQQIRISGRARLPLVGIVEVKGSADPQFRDPALEAQGRMSIPFPGLAGDFQYAFQADRFGYTIRYALATDEGVLRLVRSGPTLETLDEDALRAELQDAGQRGAPKPSAAEEDVINRLEPVPLPGTPATAPTDHERSPVLARRTVSWDSSSGPLRIYRGVPDERTILTVNKEVSGISEPGRCHFVLWGQDDPACALLVIDHSQRRVLLLSGPTGGQVTNKPQDLTHHFKNVAKLFEGSEEQRELLHEIARVWCYHHSSGRDPQAPEPTAGGYVIQYARERTGAGDDLVSWRAFCWSRDGIAGSVRLVSPSNAAPSAEFLERIAEHRPRFGRGVVVSCDQSTLQALVPVPGSEGRRHVLRQSDGSRESDGPVFVTVTPVHRLLNYVAPVLPVIGRAGLPVADTTVVLGPQGACAIAKHNGQDLFVLIPSQEPLQDGALAEPVYREQINAWQSDTRRFLPTEWQNPHTRERLTAEEIAAVMVGDWEKNRHAGWQANPLGLLLGLAERRPN